MYLLVRRGLVRTLTELLAEARRLAENEEEEDQALIQFLEAQNPELPPELALRKFEVGAMERRHWDTTAFMEAAADRTVALIPPLPPHLCAQLLPLPGCRIVQLDEHEVPASFRARAIGCSHDDIFAARRFARQAEIIAFDGHLAGRLRARAAVVDLLTGLSAGVRLLCHLRPHPDPVDEDFPASLRPSVTFF